MSTLLEQVYGGRTEKATAETLKWTLEDRPSSPSPLHLSLSVSGVPSQLHCLNYKVASVVLCLCSALPSSFAPFPLSHSLNCDFLLSLSVELQGNQSLFCMSSFASKLTMPACSTVNNVSSVGCRGNGPLNKS